MCRQIRVSFFEPCLFALALAAGVWAQMRANTYANTFSSYRVNTGVYSGGATGSVKYGSTARLMPSEVRYARRASGALPSEVRMGARGVGPLTSQGAIGYVPEAQTEIQRTMRLPEKQLYNPAYNLHVNSTRRQVNAAPAGSISFGTGTRTRPSGSSSIYPSLVGSPAMAGTSLSPSPADRRLTAASGSSGLGAIRYSGLARGT